MNVQVEAHHPENLRDGVSQTLRKPCALVKFKQRKPRKCGCVLHESDAMQLRIPSGDSSVGALAEAVWRI